MSELFADQTYILIFLCIIHCAIIFPYIWSFFRHSLAPERLYYFVPFHTQFLFFYFHLNFFLVIRRAILSFLFYFIYLFSFFITVAFFPHTLFSKDCISLSFITYAAYILSSILISIDFFHVIDSFCYSWASFFIPRHLQDFITLFHFIYRFYFFRIYSLEC